MVAYSEECVKSGGVGGGEEERVKVKIQVQHVKCANELSL